MNSALEAIFRPRAVAIVGASHDPGKRGYQAVRALLEAGYTGRIMPVNPRGGELLGLPVARSIAELEAVPDLALISLPASATPAAVSECGVRGIRGAVVLALGFAETGPAGVRLQQELRAAVARTGVRVVGPNTSGILNLPIGLNLIGARGVRPGRIGLLVQSGNMALSLLNEATTGSREGISICVGAGNQVDLGFADYLRFLNDDPNTAVIAMYVEGFLDGRAFFEASRDPARTKPIVLLKGGRSSAGARAAQSHTGALTGEYSVVRAALRQAGVIEVTRTDELFSVAETLARQPAARAGIAVLSDGGGHATLSVDVLSELGARLASLDAETEVRLRALLGPNASTCNPVDLANAPDAAPHVIADALRILYDDPAVGGVLMAGLFGGYALRFSETLAGEEARTAHDIGAIARAAGKTLVVSSLYAARDTEPLRVLRAAQVPVIGSLEVACRCIAAAAHDATPEGRRNAPGVRLRPAAADVLAVAQAERRCTLLEPEARMLISRYGIRVVQAELCASKADAVAALHRLGGTVVMKVVAPSLPHKTEAGGVLLNVSTEEGAREGFQRLRMLAADVRGVLVTPMLPPPIAELLVGATRDPQFGPVLTIAAGGTAVELLRAAALRLLPVSGSDIESMLNESVVGRLLHGARGRPPGDCAALRELALNLADCFLSNAELADLEVNPVFVYEESAIAVDARAFVRTA